MVGQAWSEVKQESVAGQVVVVVCLARTGWTMTTKQDTSQLSLVSNVDNIDTWSSSRHVTMEIRL